MPASSMSYITEIGGPFLIERLTKEFILHLLKLEI
jgi:hypothetical protein